MCLAISNNLLLVLQDAPKRFFFFYELATFLSAKKRRKDTFFPTLRPFSTVIFATATVLAFVLLRVLGSTSTAIHSVKQRLLRNRSGSALRPLASSCAKDYKAHSLQQTSLTESPNRDDRRCQGDIDTDVVKGKEGGDRDDRRCQGDIEITGVVMVIQR